MIEGQLVRVLLLAALLVTSGALVSFVPHFGGSDSPAAPVNPAMVAGPADADDPPNTFGMSQAVEAPKPGDPIGYTR